MLKSLYSALIIFFVLTSLSFADSGPILAPGKWEMKFVMGIGNNKMFDKKSFFCQSNSNTFDFSQKLNLGEDCETTDSTINGDMVTWSFTCIVKADDTDLEFKGKFRLIFSEESINGNLVFSVTGTGMTGSGKISAQHIGDCD
jgi:hypothetical protein